MDKEFGAVVGTLTSQSKFQIKLDLSRMKAILACFDNPQDRLKFIHVAGTNGKGSVCCVLGSVLHSAGIKVGLYTSPHLVSYCERFKINGLDVSESVFVEYCTQVLGMAKLNDIDLTEFEILTTVAFLYFAKNDVDIVVLETGLGGRFDATNVISDNICSVITSISLDHTDRLGDTVEKIAFEKAGIIKESPVVISETNAGLEVIKKRASNLIIADENNVDIRFEHGKNLLTYNDYVYEFGLLGLFQKDNMSLVISVVEYLRGIGYVISDVALREGLACAKWSCRMEYIQDKNLILDGAHNVDAAKRLKEALDYYFPNKKRVFIYGTLVNKDYEGICRELFTESDDVYFCEFDYPNSLKFSEFNVRHAKFISLTRLAEVTRALTPEEVGVLCGSFYLLGDLKSKEIV